MPCVRTAERLTTQLGKSTTTPRNMSMYGSNPRLAPMGQRSNSRPDLASPSFRNEVFVGGNGFHEGFQAADNEGYTYTSFSRSSTHGGGFGGQKMSTRWGTAGGGGMR